MAQAQAALEEERQAGTARRRELGEWEAKAARRQQALLREEQAAEERERGLRRREREAGEVGVLGVCEREETWRSLAGVLFWGGVGRWHAL